MRCDTTNEIAKKLMFHFEWLNELCVKSNYVDTLMHVPPHWFQSYRSYLWFASRFALCAIKINYNCRPIGQSPIWFGIYDKIVAKEACCMAVRPFIDQVVNASPSPRSPSRSQQTHQINIVWKWKLHSHTHLTVILLFIKSSTQRQHKTLIN